MFIEVEGGGRAAGELTVQGAKNAVLPMIAATVLCRKMVILENCPRIQDVYSMTAVLKGIGADVRWDGDKLMIDASRLDKYEIAQKEAGEVRASILFLGSLLGRTGKAEICMPGGCSIGARPIDFHLAAFEQMGADVELEEEVVHCAIQQQGEEVVELPYPSVGATENVILYAVLRQGDTELRNAAKEPEIIELCEFLRCMGAEISGDGSSRIVIHGVSELHETTYRLRPDRIAFMTYAAMAVATGGSVMFRGSGREREFEHEKNFLALTGCQIHSDEDGILVSGNGSIKAVPYLKTGPYPEFPTDAQSLFLALLTRAYGESIIEESVFENRFLVAAQLRKMGADIETAGQRACIRGVTRLHGESVRATDLRSGAALIVAGLMADGTTVIDNCHFVLRGYESPVENIQSLGLCARYICE